MSSSPDPLNDSPTFYGRSKARRTSKARRSLPLQGSSPTKQTFELDVGDQISKQKIRVTVEAGDSKMGNVSTNYNGRVDDSPLAFHAPLNHWRERTFTTIVPVRGLSDPENEQQTVTPIRGRRPKKSAGNGTPVPTKKKRERAKAPTGKATPRRKSFGEPDNSDDDVTFEVGKNIVARRGNSRSQSRSRAAKRVPKSPVGKKTIGSSTATKKGRRKSAVVAEVKISENIGIGADTPEQEGSSGEQNKALSPSAYSTIRTTTIGEHQADDILIARFDPGNDTPQRTGWSSPKTFDAPAGFKGELKFNGQDLNRLNMDNFMHSRGQSLEAGSDFGSPVRENSNSEEDAQDEVPYDYEEEEAEEDDEVGEMGDFDTIMESEGFSMISVDSVLVDSVLSLRDHYSSPVNPNPPSQNSKPLMNKNILSVQEVGLPLDDSFGDVPEEILEAASPVRKDLEMLSNVSHSGSLQEIRNEEAIATESSNSGFLSQVGSQTKPLEDATPARLTPQARFLARTIKHDDSYEDSFSAIPPAILEAATPAAKRQTSPKAKSDVAPSDKSDAPGPKSKLFSNQPMASLSPRMLTPEETPSPTSQETSIEPEDDELEALPPIQPGNESSLMNSQMPSSPPSAGPRRYTYMAHLRQNRHLQQDLTETPYITLSSPSLPPAQPPRLQLGIAQAFSESPRPPLSPIARAGRVLQDVVVPSPSPRSRSQSLGSPFKSPSSNRSSPSQDYREKLIPKLSMSDDMTDLSSKNIHWSRLSNQEDPFRNELQNGNHRSLYPNDKQGYSLEPPEKRQRPSPRAANIKDTVRSFDVMSWQAKEERTISSNSGSTSNNLGSSLVVRASSEQIKNSTNSTDSNNIWEQKWVAERAKVSKQISSANSDQVIVIDDKPSQDDDEDFELLLETMRSSSPTSCEPQVQLKEGLEKPKRNKIPSPWKKNNKRLVYSDEMSHFSPPPVASEYVAGNIIEAAAEPITVRRVITSNQSNEESINDADASGWQIPQKLNFQPRVRESGGIDLSALLCSSPAKTLPVLSTNSSSQPDKISERSQPPVAKSQGNFNRIPQKMGFAPRARSGVLEMFESSPTKPVKPGVLADTIAPGSSGSIDGTIKYAPMPLAMFSGSQVNIPLANSTATSRSSPEYINNVSASVTSNVKKEDREHAGSTIKWSENDQLASSNIEIPPILSPAKSCLRSPLKTPSTSHRFMNESPSKAVAFVSSSPMPPSPLAFLSSTTWSEDHWRLLESILQKWKLEIQQPSQESDGSARRRRNSTRVISKLLGRRIHIEGEELVMEQWHLEVVDEFRGQVPGLEEKVVAKRVFALIIGEKKRNKETRGAGDI